MIGLLIKVTSFGFEPIVSHPPMRPLPEPSQRPLPEKGLRFVDAAKGDDANDGSIEHPWRTVSFAVKQLKSDDTLI